MKKLLMLPLLAGVALPVQALPPLGDPGLDGTVNVGYAGGQVKSNFLAKIDNLGIDLGDRSINKFGDPDSENFGMPIATIDIGWVFANGRTRLSVGNGFFDLVEFDRTSRVSLRHDFDQAGAMRLDYLSPAGFATRVYADPYQTNVRRRMTDMETSGVQFVWDNIYGSGVGLDIVLRNRDIDDEFSGAALVSSGQLSQSEARLLDRNGDIRTYELSYRYVVDERHSVRPAIQYIDRDLDGKAMAQDGVSLSVGHNYQGQDVTWASRISYTDLDGDKRNPIFGDRNGASGFAVTSMVAFPGMMGGWTPNLSVNWVDLDSDIDFNNYGLWTVGAGISLSF